MSRQECVDSNFQFIWEIKDFVRNLQTIPFQLHCHEFSIKCIEPSIWSLKLIPSLTENDYQVSCKIARLSDGDELYSLSVSLTIEVEDETGNHHFQRIIPPITMGKGKDDETVQSLITSQTDLKNFHYPGSVLLRFNFQVSANRIQTSNFNLSPGLQMLSLDLEKLYLSNHLQEAVILVKGTWFHVHLAVLHARWPNFSNYLKLFPDLIKKDYLDFHSIQLEVLIKAAVEVSLDIYSPENLYEEEEGKVTQILTPKLFNYLLYFTYTGQCKRVKDGAKPNLFKLCQYFQFYKLLEKYQEIPVAVSCCNKASKSHYILDWNREDGKFWERTGFQPFVQIIEPHEQDSGLLEVKFIIQGDDFIILFKSLEGDDGVSISCMMQLKYGNRFAFERTFNGTWMGSKNESFPVKVGVTKTDVLSMILTIDLTLCYCYNPHHVKNEFYLTSEKTVCPQSLHSYSLDFENLYTCDKMPDMTMIAKGKVLDAHKYILSARSLQFQTELRTKLSRDYKFIHLVSGISHNILDAMLKYIYSGRLEIDEIDNVNDLLKAANRYKLKHLIKKCENYLAEKQGKNKEG
ncbi:hypothetical protein TNIN_172881 [Trichonephila inaurata madagascariensis]|uniref:BTB domain-containing protein n=1 Tax=Trichonephila inaurata madagascariensis TaxID=2747483 RepID=A0A8X7BY30_9ARAC|nr:hypothetical protein TNIN_172881 [Trichonephila inaurata madagascariensis]